MNIMIDAYLDNNLGDDLMIRYFASYFHMHNIYIVETREEIRKSFEDIPNIYFCSERNYSDTKVNFQLHVTIGGSMFILDEPKKWIRFRHRIKNARALRHKTIPSATIGSNLGPFDKQNIGLRLARWELKNKNLITVRDTKSYELLQNDFKRMKISLKFFPDIVFSRIREKKSPTYGLGISVYRSLDPEIDNIQNYTELAMIANNFIRETGKKVALFAFDSENENDLVAAHKVQELITERDKVDIIPYLGQPEHFIEKFLKCEKIIGIRFHSSVLALVSGIPLYAIAYSNKTQNLMSDLGLSKYCSSLSNLGKDASSIENQIKMNDLAILNDKDRHDLSRRSLGHFLEIERLINDIYEKGE